MFGITDGGVLLDLLSAAADIRKESVLRLTPEGIYFDATDEQESFVLQYFIDQLQLAYYYLKLLPEEEGEDGTIFPAEEYIDIGLDLSKLCLQLKQIGKNKVYMFQLFGEDKITVEIRKQGIPTFHTVDINPHLKYNETNIPEFTRPKENPNCKLAASGLKQYVSNIKNSKPVELRFYHKSNNLMIVYYEGVVSPDKSTYNYLQESYSGKSSRLKYPESDNYIAVNIHKFTKVMPKLCDSVGSGLFNLYMDERPEKDMPLKLVAPIGGFGDMAIHILHFTGLVINKKRKK